jgi:hypothetical protein
MVVAEHSEVAMDEFVPGQLGFLQAWLIGGPLDGTTYNDMPIFPGGKPADEAAIPLDDGLFARYARRDEVWLDGRWYYDFVEVTTDPTPIAPQPLPTGTVVGSAASAPPAAQEEISHDASPQVAPAPRFVLAQAWWIASELCRRNSQLRIVDAWPLNGFYHGLEVGERQNDDHVFMNLLGRIHQNPYSFGAEFEPIEWSRAISAESPHEIVKEIERNMRWTSTTTDSTTPRSLVYQCIASILATRINDRERWDIADACTAGGFVEWPELLDEFEGCRVALQKDTIADPPPSTRVWVLKRGRAIVSVLSDMGLLFHRDRAPQDLMAAYRNRRRLDDVTSLMLDS